MAFKQFSHQLRFMTTKLRDEMVNDQMMVQFIYLYQRIKCILAHSTIHENLINLQKIFLSWVTNYQ